jgi:pSer/pThr/pTyr-binding forkhead associated (FHA) protein
MALRFRVLPTDDTRPAGRAGPAGPLVERDLDLPDELDPIRVGRRADVELPLPFAVLSGMHARLTRDASGGGWLVEDLGSTNGTWLDGARLPPGERRPLAPGAELRLGTVRLRFEGAGSAAPAAAGTATIARRLVDDLFAGGDGGDAPAIRVARGAPAASLSLAVRGRPYVAGRAETCSLCLPVEEVSREHAAFVRNADGVIVRDLASKNGVVVNGAPIAGDHPLEDGDTVAIGPVTLRLDDPVARYLREVESLPPEGAPLLEPAVEPISPPPADPVAPPRRRSKIGAPQLIAISAGLVLLLLAAVTAALFWPTR